MNRYSETGDGDRCPQDPSHGRMWFIGTTRQWCPSSRHSGENLYLRDGLTPVSRPAIEPAPGGALRGIGSTADQATGHVGQTGAMA